jgi:hypothetical protein
VDCGRFVPHVNQLKVCIESGIEHRHDVISGEREYALHARCNEGLHERVSAALFRLHGLSI